MMCGGAKPAEPADKETQDLVDLMKPHYEGKSGENCAEFTAISVSKQVVAGMNFFVKVHTGNEKYVHLRIYRPLPNQGDPSLHSFQQNKNKEDPIGFFD
ncbi:hypothetical protein CAPTEDRAFT_21979 [Capitella teleta]|uniref:Cystatin domain-containing protein n=1 Tax=Capitella teleta TaxID=283909 RepID=R7VIQ1_CAPTE|nr:hypothetical protein CAPTEDRAFT_21979 [Capitella teleta]|eukprot:ELU18698.1 hypothetical protein CAPTEDRAFT_21979 [Capitella teleta]